MPSSSPLAPCRLPSASHPPMTTRRIAVIGAGAAGLVAARELLREGHRVVVFERGGSVGGTWVYTPAVESDPLGLDPAREVVHSSLYESLRTNLPRESMGFLDYPFVARHSPGNGDGEGDPRRFPSHPEVLRYLEDFVRDFDLYGLVRFWTEVGLVERKEDGRWAVRWRRVSGKGGDESEVYDAVVVCIGHYTQPRVAEIPGIDAWPGKQMHSHNYRVPKPFIDQVVVIIGSSTSAHDISRDISGFAKEVHIASRSALDGTPSKLPGHGNVWLHSMVESANEDGHVVFQDGSSIHVDVIMHCTGYRYHFPFLNTNGIVNVDDNRVGPLYKHIFPPELAPCLSFIGIPWRVKIPFPVFELQSKWVAGVLSGRIAAPTQEEMMEDLKAFYLQMEVAGWPKRYTHNLVNFQFEYHDWLAHECGYPEVEEWRRQMFVANTENRIARPESYRDEWDDDRLVAEAHSDFQKFL